MPREDDDDDEQAEELTNDRTDDIQDHSQPAAEPAGGIEPAPMPSDPGCTLIVPPLTLLSTSPRRTAAPADKAVSSPGTPESDSKTLSSAESSDDEDKETSILPSSVLDQAGTIALHFSTSTRRGSVPSASGDDGATAARSLGCPSPRLPGSSRTASTLSLAAEPAADRSQQRLHSACSDDQENEGGATDDLTLLSPREDSLFDGGGDLLRGGALRRRRDSTLSKQDQMLIGKIKCYYETAESQDPVFSLRRRESLSYIPAGLVRNSVTRINSIPVKDPTSDSDAEAAGAAAAVEEVTMEENRPDDSPPIPAPVPEASSASAALRPERRPPQQEEVREERSGAVEDEEFRPSSEMIKIWRAMERDICGTTQGEPGGGGGGGGREKRSRELARNSRVSALSLSNRNHQTPRKNSEGERDGAAAVSGESDLTTITEESAGPSALRSSRPPGRSSAGLAAVGRSCDQEGGLLRARPTRVQQLRANAVGERSRAPEPQQPLDHDDQAKSKVLHLARQYSQKIKSSKQPVVVQHRSLQHKMLPCVLEESDALSGKATTPGSPLTSSRETLSSSSSSLSLAAERLRAPPAPPPDPCTSDTMAGLRLLLLSSSSISSPGQNPNPHPPVAAATRSPVSPTPPTEGFPWPHVRELRSKYVPRPDQTTPPVGRSQSVPERMLDGGAKRRSSCSSNLFQASSDSASSYQSHPSRGQQRRSVRLHRTSSLDPRLSRTRPSSSVLEKQHTHTVRLPNGGHHDAEGYYVSGSAPLPGGSRKLLVMEKVPDSSPLGGAEPSGVEMLAREVREAGAEQEVDDDKDSYVQIRSPTSREKMSIMAVIERCRAYQESDEYKQREQDKEEEAGLKAEPVAVGGRGKEEGTAPNSTEQKTDDGTHSMVKSLREKFQNLK